VDEQTGDAPLKRFVSGSKGNSLVELELLKLDKKEQQDFEENVPLG
jgi:hypothetical protein